MHESDCPISKRPRSAPAPALPFSYAMQHSQTGSHTQQIVRRKPDRRMPLTFSQPHRCPLVLAGTGSAGYDPRTQSILTSAHAHCHQLERLPRRSLRAYASNPAGNGSAAPISDPFIFFEDPNDQPLGSDGLPHRGKPHKHHWVSASKIALSNITFPTRSECDGRTLQEISVCKTHHIYCNSNHSVKDAY